MKKTIIKSVYKLKVFNDGSSGYIWTHNWKNWIILSPKDITTHHVWNSNLEDKTKVKESYLEKYTKTFNK